MNASLIVVVAVFVFVLVTIGKGIRIVAQGEEWIVERLGKYHGTLLPGLRLIIPYIDKVAYKVVTKDIILDVQEQEVITGITLSFSPMPLPSSRSPIRSRRCMA